jgi:hypothetical protein
VSRVTKIKQRAVAVIDPRTMSLKLEKGSLRKKFADGTPIKSFAIKRVRTRWYLTRLGKDRKGNCHLWRNEVEFTSDGRLVLAGKSKTGCIGAPCSACRISPDGTSCSCKIKGGHCNHTISSGLVAFADVFRS